ncbi:sodium/calcium exchanger family protein [Cellulomonas hominis]|uniref:Cation:H+ antiporter n=1 Tax=Cellulomonas hominis TaxID=156981 RepID=A0A511FCL1_9CELL|nr:sodium:proton exchanger [Cellulomonas hominis]MBB5472886.1 cation:H+ antiporter [Cellulomonas hominis]GEL46981.1 sodium/calcium exchanger family protein [Cellulomonas hominis]
MPAPDEQTLTTPAAPLVPPPSPRVLIRSLAIAGVIMVPALITRFSGASPAPVLELVIFGAAVVAASFVLAWAAEAAQVDVSGGFAIAVLALIAVLPEYAVDLYYAYTAGSDPAYVQYAAANMTGSNRLLLGLGWPLVVLVSLYVAGRVSKKPATALALDPENRMELGFLLIAGVVAFIIPATGHIHLVFGVVMIAWFGFYLYKLTRGEAEEPDLIGTAAAIGALPRRKRRATVIALFVLAATIILLCAEPFAEALVASGTSLGIDEFLLVQWLAPLASEAPEFIIAVLFAWRGKGTAAIATLISSKINQWTLLVGSLPIAYLAGGGSASLVLDTRQTEEMLLTAAQTLMGIAILLGLRFHRWSAWALLALFVVQFPLTSTHGRFILSGVYLAIAAVILVIQRRHIVPTLTAPFRRHQPEPEPAPADAA